MNDTHLIYEAYRHTQRVLGIGDILVFNVYKYAKFINKEIGLVTDLCPRPDKVKSDNKTQISWAYYVKVNSDEKEWYIEDDNVDWDETIRLNTQLEDEDKQTVISLSKI